MPSDEAVMAGESADKDSQPRHAFQCIATVKESDGPEYLVAVSGPCLIVTDLEDGTVASEWAAEVKAERKDEHERPAKKQKTEKTAASLPNVIKLAVAPNHLYIVAVTDDKCVRVFAILAKGQLAELSERFMPKRPCAIQVLPDNATILCGDKFGDVYSLPLLPSTDVEKTTKLSSEPSTDSSTLFKPSATTQTVHTKRNLKSLEAQMKQKHLTPKTKEPLKFEHQLLLGHVSMLTDLTYATQHVDGKDRGYIITADRDEHIRVSRGPPQSHIIEGYCSGHKEFVSIVCLVPGTDLLVSGGGDDWLGVWEWPAYKLERKIALPRTHEGQQQVAVSGIWIVRLNDSGVTRSAVIVALEKSTSVVVIPVSDLTSGQSDIDKVSTHDFERPVLDVAALESGFIASFNTQNSDEKCLGAFELTLDNSKGVLVQHRDDLNKALNAASDVRTAIDDDEKFEDLLFGVEKLRKRGYQDGDCDDRDG